jgi:hypothetical protein
MNKQTYCNDKRVKLQVQPLKLLRPLPPFAVGARLQRGRRKEQKLK